MGGFIGGLIHGLIASGIIAARNSEEKHRQEKIKQCEEDLRNEKPTNDKFEEIVNNTERKEDEDSISYLARCMREAESNEKERNVCER